MASVFFKPKPVTSTAPDWYEKLLAVVATAVATSLLAIFTAQLYSAGRDSCRAASPAAVFTIECART